MGGLRKGLKALFLTKSMKKTLIVINGEAGSGKDTFVQFCQQILGKDAVKNIHSSDHAKNVLKIMKWNGEKDEETRRLLADLVAFGEKTGFNTSNLYSFLNCSTAKVVFYHQRDPKVIDKIKNRYWFDDDIEVITLLIDRKLKKQETDRWGIKDFEYDYIIKNDTSLIGLLKKAHEFLQKIRQV